MSALFPIVDPVGGNPVFLSLTLNYDTKTRRLLARRIAINSFILLVASFTIGSHVLSFFGISLPLVQVGGGMIEGKHDDVPVANFYMKGPIEEIKQA